ncbi:MAG TPA: response regulator [Cyclobacteriaceae bacterium]
MQRSCKFIVIDDNEIDRMVTSLLIQRNLGESDIILLNSGADGIDWLKRHKHNVTKEIIILLDIKMPLMDGFEFLDELDDFDESLKKSIFVFLLSSTLDPTDINRAGRHKHVKTLLSKPLITDELNNALNAL